MDVANLTKVSKGKYKTVLVLYYNTKENIAHRTHAHTMENKAH